VCNLICRKNLIALLKLLSKKDKNIKTLKRIFFHYINKKYKKENYLKKYLKNRKKNKFIF